MPQFDTPTVRRTRGALVDAAIEIWSRNGAAGLGEIAARSGVGRTTLHRHFTDRATLLAAVDAECRARFAAAARRARPQEDTGLAAYGRILGELLPLGDVLGLIFADNALIDPDTWAETDDQGYGSVVARGQADRSINPALPPAWISTLFWTTLLGGYLYLRDSPATVREATDLATDALTRAIATDIDQPISAPIGPCRK